MSDLADELIPTRETLLSRLKDLNDQESWKDFFETYWRLIYCTALKSGLSEQDAQDVVQETILCVCKTIPGFKYNRKGSFKSWLLRLTSWRIADQFRRRGKEVPFSFLPGTGTETDPSGFVQALDPRMEDIWEEQWKANLFHAALERVKGKADPKAFQIFDLYVGRGWPVKKIARELNLGPGRIYLAKHRITALIKKEIKRLEQETL